MRPILRSFCTELTLRTVLDGACGTDVYGHNGVSVGASMAMDLMISMCASPAVFQTAFIAIEARNVRGHHGSVGSRRHRKPASRLFVDVNK